MLYIYYLRFAIYKNTNVHEVTIQRTQVYYKCKWLKYFKIEKVRICYKYTGSEYIRNIYKYIRILRTIRDIGYSKFFVNLHTVPLFGLQDVRASLV
jgi:hypothetical protein